MNVVGRIASVIKFKKMVTPSIPVMKTYLTVFYLCTQRNANSSSSNGVSGCDGGGNIAVVTVIVIINIIYKYISNYIVHPC